MDIETKDIDDGTKATPEVGHLEGILTAFDQKMEQREARMFADLKTRLEEHSKPERALAERVTGGGETIVGGTTRTTASDLRYQRMSQAEKPWRSAEGDHWMAQWLRAFAKKDRAGCFEAQAKLDGIFGRATTEEGVADTNGGIADGTGAELLPHPLAQVVMIARDKVAKARRFATSLTMTTQTLQVPTAGAFTAATVAEGAVAAQGEPAFDSQMMTAIKYQCYAKASVEMLADSAFNLVTIYGQRAGAALGALEDAEIFGAGSTVTVTEAFAGGNVAEATSTVLIYEDLVTLYFSVPQQYRANAVWFGDTTTLTLLSTLVDSSDRPILSDYAGRVGAVTDDSADGVLFRKPVYEVNFATAGTLFFGDPTGYAVASRSGIEIASSTHSDFAADLVAFKFTMRGDGAIIDQTGMKQMAGLASVA